MIESSDSCREHSIIVALRNLCYYFILPGLWSTTESIMYSSTCMYVTGHWQQRVLGNNESTTYRVYMDPSSSQQGDEMPHDTACCCQHLQVHLLGQSFVKKLGCATSGTFVARVTVPSPRPRQCPPPPTTTTSKTTTTSTRHCRFQADCLRGSTAIDF